MLKPIAPLLLSASILLGGNGVLGTLIALRGSLEGFDTVLVGLMGACYYLGFFAASFHSARLIRRTGHVRAFAALAAIGALVPLVMAMTPNPWVWLVMRVFSGFCFAALLMVVESWINEISKNDSRGRVLGVYRILDLLAVTGTQFLIPLVGEGGHEIFSVVSMMYCLSLVPVALSTRARPAAPENLKLDLGAIWRISPLACLTSLAIGLTNSAFRLVGPLYGLEIGLDTGAVVVFMTLGIVGGAALQYPLGYMSDKVGRRSTVLFSTFGAMLAAVFLSGQSAVLPVYIGAFAFGAFALPLYSLAAAHANDRAGIGQYVLVSAGLSFYFALGAVIGPYAASLVIEYLGAPAFFLYTCAVHATLCLVVIIRSLRRAAVPAERRSRFVGLLRTSPMFFRLARRFTRSRGRGK
ncbi:MAG: MFS transporter [Arenicellales bacterium IbO2]|nr:MFS transporter [Gammaproteobacteria bacterium]MDA7995522.1 MFS transporter [Gammaproteobacteria bacterium]MDA8024081.1 MFS transporter [Gammaproteobacteria bacterium]CAJ2377197.1 MAG: MFS transporter [Arenicellales bacterium IbO2]